MNSNVVKGIGLLGKAVFELTEKQFSVATTDFFAALGLFGVHSSIIGAMKAKGMGVPENA
jgi:hypothetical protein